jgi:hypothetical protein
MCEDHETFIVNKKSDSFLKKIQENELDSARSKCSKLQRDHELLMIEKSDRIKDLQDQVTKASSKACFRIHMKLRIF